MSGKRASIARNRFVLAIAVAGCAVAACATDTDRGDPPPPLAKAQQALTTPVGLAIEIDNGAGRPLKIQKGQTFYLNQIDVRASRDASVDEDVKGLAKGGDFASLAWGGTHQVDQEFVLLANADGTYTKRRFFRGAAWMNVGSRFTLQQLAADGSPLGAPVVVSAGLENQATASDDFWDRRFRAIQWTYDCPSSSDCTGATHFSEEALVELRYAMHPERTFVIDPAATSLSVTWSLKPNQPYSIPVTQVSDAPYAYGFSIDLAATTPPRPDGTYAPGSAIDFQITLRDGQGNRLHPPGSLPTYDEVIFGANEAGIQYYRAFFDPTTTYYRRKHRERMMMSQIIGPVQDVQAIRSIADLGEFLAPDDVQTTGTLERDGVFAQFRTIPTAHDLFGGAFDPEHAAWAAPVPDHWTYKLPDNAPSGTYLVTVKGRRTYMGEDVPYTRTVEIQVGTTTHTSAHLETGGCQSCHNGQSSLGKLLHANANRAACASCHVPLGFELEGPIFVRTHFIHSRSNRFDAPLEKCSSCHLTAESIQRTSKAACLSCHKSYPKSHVDQFGAVKSMYVGGGRESFETCTSSCHTTHPGSGLDGK